MNHKAIIELKNAIQYPINKIGKKAFKLSQLLNNDINVPDGLVILKNEKFELDRIVDLIDSYFKPGTYLAIRASGEKVMPGILKTIINVGCRNNTLSKQNYYYLIKSFLSNEKCDYKHDIKKLESFFSQENGYSFPQNRKDQIKLAILEIERNANSNETLSYLQQRNLTFVNYSILIQPMVFGNLNLKSGAGIFTTINPITKEKGLFGEYLPQSMGIEIASGEKSGRPLETINNKLYLDLYRNFKLILGIFKDDQEIEFVYENNKLFILQSTTIK